MDAKNLTTGMKVMINYNVEEPQKVGYYYDMLITDINSINGKLDVCGTLFVG